MRSVFVTAVVLVTGMVATAAFAQNTRPPENAENIAAGKAIFNGMGQGINSFRRHSTLTNAEKNALCLQCHEEDYDRKAWRGSAHETQDVACVNCHTIMKANSATKQLKKKTVVETCYQCHPQKRAQIRKSSHMPIAEGKTVCTKCHNPHGGEGYPLLKQASVNETCYQCHADKRGPLLWEHAPVRENCENCHDPHGSNNASLLKRRVPFLCQSCHVSALHPSEVYDARRIVGGASPAGRIAGKACLNCHSRIHGSNHPSGARFQR